VDKKSNEITALPPVLKELAHRGVVFASHANIASLIFDFKEFQITHWQYFIYMDTNKID
jgi:hypothetical protein